MPNVPGTPVEELVVGEAGGANGWPKKLKDTLNALGSGSVAQLRSKSLTQPARNYRVITAEPGIDGWTLSNGIAGDATDVSDSPYSNSSAYITTAGGGAWGTIEKVGNAAVNMTGKAFRALVKTSDLDHLQSFEFFAGVSSFSRYWLWQVNFPGAVNALFGSNEWVWVTLNWQNAQSGGSPTNEDRAALTDFRLVARDSNEGVQVTTRLGAVLAQDDPTIFPNGVVSFSFDDAHGTQALTGRQGMAKYGFAGTLFPILEGVSESGLSLNNMRNLHDVHGWEVGCHASTSAVHAQGLPNLSIGQRQAELEYLKTWNLQNGFSRGNDVFAYPLGTHDEDSIADVRKYFSCARTTYAGTYETAPAGDPYRLRSIGVGPATNLGDIGTAVDAAYANKGWLLMHFHGFVPSSPGDNDITIANFESILAYVNSKGMPVRPIGDVLSTAV